MIIRWETNRAQISHALTGITRKNALTFSTVCLTWKSSITILTQGRKFLCRTVIRNLEALLQKLITRNLRKTKKRIHYYKRLNGSKYLRIMAVVCIIFKVSMWSKFRETIWIILRASTAITSSILTSW